MLVTGFCVLILAVALPTALILSFAMLPTFCALATDRSPGRSAVICVGSLNFAGTWPFLLGLWGRGHSVANAMQTMFDPYAWLVIYSAAAAGWMLYMLCPSLVAFIMSVSAVRRAALLRQQQKNLIAEWGEEVVVNKDRASPP